MLSLLGLDFALMRSWTRLNRQMVEVLAHPEPGFFTLGIKSYGRRSDFLIRTGLEQVQTVLDSFQQKQV